MTSDKQTVREVALDILIRIEKSGSFSHLMINHSIEKGHVNYKDAGLLTEIVYGTLERKLSLRYDLYRFVKTKKRMDPWVETLLFLSLYQMRYLNNVPTYAIINEAVTIAKKRGHKGISSFVNGILREADRRGAVDFSEIQDQAERLSLETSHPLWLVESWMNQYGYEVTEKMCQMNVTEKPLYLRVNRTKKTREEVLDSLAELGIEAEAVKEDNYGIMVRNGNVIQTDLIQEGQVTVQDLSSLLASRFVEAEAGMAVIDACAAPGGKTTAIAEAMEGQGQVYAYDLHKNKTKLIKENAKRLAVRNIQAKAHDARKLSELHEAETIDRILVDAPCSGLGIVRSKPDIKYQKTEADIERLSDIQTDILQKVAPLLKVGGKLIYSTCTVDKRENNEVVQKFLSNNPQFKIDPSFIKEAIANNWQETLLTDEGLQIFPQSFNADGFFVTRFVKLDGEDGE